MRMCAACWLLAAACSGSSSSSTPKAPAADAGGRVEPLQIGTLEAYVLEDGYLEVPNDAQLLGVGRAPNEIAELLAAAGLSRDTIRLDLQGLLVKAGERTLLFDTGTGDPSLAHTGRLAQSLARAGVQPSAVTDIFISHAHSDHVGGLLTKAGALVYPAATIHMSAAEWASFRANTDDESKRFVAAIASKVTSFEPGAQVLPVVKAVATPGHTPGHTSYEIGDAEKLFYLGDVAHHSVISVQRTAWSIQVDADHAQAEATRQQTLAKLAADRARVFAFHFPFPGVGHVVADGQGFVWKPDALD